MRDPHGLLLLLLWRWRRLTLLASHAGSGARAWRNDAPVFGALVAHVVGLRAQIGGAVFAAGAACVVSAASRLSRSESSAAAGNAAPNVIRILVDRDFASSFLAAHIGQFLLRNPGVSVEVVAERNGRLRLDEDFNFRIFYGHYGAKSYPGLREEVLCHWYDLTVCTSDYAAAHVSAAGDLMDAQLLIDGNYDVWDDWFVQTGQRHPGTLRQVTHFIETSLCLSAAMSGGGITIGDSILAFPAIRSGRLALPFRHGLESLQCYSLFLRSGAHSSMAEAAFRNWLRQVVQDHQAEVNHYFVDIGINLIRRGSAA